ncbi:MAG: nitroreductase family deazaflavin-dependent oxidoreductase [Actinomycetales bacterium]
MTTNVTTIDAPAVPRFARTLNRVTSPWTMPIWLGKAHRWLYVRSGGRVGHGMIGAPALVLRTVGRKSGMVRTTTLAYAHDGGELIVAASFSGADRHPAWFHNLRANPEVEVQIGRRAMTAQARVVEASEPEHRRLWPLLNAGCHGRYDYYQAQTIRPIPLVLLQPKTPTCG